jgi:hypothetical protein
MDVEKYIAGLLFEYDCVIVPGFGGFIGSYAHARIHPVSHSFSPPFKSILFNVSLKQNDGLLANRISNREKITYAEASSLVDELTGEWMRMLIEKKFINIHHVGVLSMDREGNIQFEQDMQNNLNPDSFGLATFVSPAIRRQGLGLRSSKKIEKYLKSPDRRRRTIPKALRWAALFALPVGAAAILSITHFDKVRNISINYTSLISSVTSEPAVKRSVPLTKIITAKPAIIKKPAVIVKEPVKEVKVAEVKKPFSIIVGAFKIEDNAVRLVADLRSKGFDARIIDVTKTGLFRVAMQNFATREEALTTLASVRSGQFSSAWLLEKNI